MPAKTREIETVQTSRVACDGEGGHPRVWLQIPEAKGWVDCPYCGKHFDLADSAGADH